MFKSSLLRQASRATATAAAARSHTVAAAAVRSFTSAPLRLDKSGGSDEPDHDRHDRHSTSSQPGEFKHEGQFSRTDNTIRFEHPDEDRLPSSQPVQGRGGFHFKRTLASFSLEDRVGVVTGGARGLGLVMSQALVVSGADVAIVDLNSKSITSRSREDLLPNTHMTTDTL